MKKNHVALYRPGGKAESKQESVSEDRAVFIMMNSPENLAKYKAKKEEKWKFCSVTEGVKSVKETGKRAFLIVLIKQKHRWLSI